MTKTVYFILLSILLINIHSLYAQECIETGKIISAAGTTEAGYSGNNGLGSLAKVNQPQGLSGDSNGNLYFADAINHVVRKVDPDGIITTIAGVAGVSGFNFSTGPAHLIQLSYPTDVAVDAAGNLYITEGISSLIRYLDVSTGIISLIGGSIINGFGYGGDGGNATDAKFQFPNAIAVNSLGEIFIADRFNHRIRKIAVDGIITTIAGNGTQGYSGDGQNALNAEINNPFDLVIDAADNIYFVDLNNNVIRKIEHTTNIITTAIGTGVVGFSGDGGLASSAEISNPQGITIDVNGNIYISDQANARIRKIDGDTGIISTVLGTGTIGYPASGTAAATADINPYNLFINNEDKLFYSEWINHRVTTFECPNTELFFEAECVTIGSNWRSNHDTRASGGKYLVYPGIGKELGSGPTDGNDIVRFIVLLPEAGMYDLYARTLTFSSFSDAFWVRINNANWLDFSNIRKSLSYIWNPLHDGDPTAPISVSLNAGLNIIEFGLQEDGTRIDKLAIIAAGGTPPDALGGDSDNCPDFDVSGDDYDFDTIDQQLKEFSVYPNPFSTDLNIAWQSDLPTDIKIINSLGQIIWEKTAAYSMDENVELQQLPAGMYIIELENEEGRKLLKIQKVNR